MKLLFTIFLLSVAAGSEAAELQLRSDIPYTDRSDTVRRLDVYTTAEATKRPVAIWIHGGAWQAGDKTRVQHKPEAFVKNGFVFVSVNYRFVPDVTVEEIAGDIAKAIKWVHTHAAEFGGTPDHMFVLGHSAGAHLAALVCTDPKYLRSVDLSLKQISGCVPVDTAAYDVPALLGRIGKLRQQTYTSVFGTDRVSQASVSPITFLAKGQDIPPFLILHVASRADSTVQTLAFANGLRRVGVETKVFAAEDKNHGSINRELGQPDDSPTEALFDFLKQSVSEK